MEDEHAQEDEFGHIIARRKGRCLTPRETNWVGVAALGNFDLWVADLSGKYFITGIITSISSMG